MYSSAREPLKLLLYKLENVHLVLLRPEVAEHRDDPRQQPRGRAQPQRHQHQEEEDGEELRSDIKLGDHLGVADEGESGPGPDHLRDGDPELVGEVAEDGEDDSPGEDGGQGVCYRDDEGIPVAIVVELVVGGVGHDHPEAHAEREEALGDGSVPDPGLQQPLPLRGEEVDEALGEKLNIFKVFK